MLVNLIKLEDNNEVCVIKKLVSFEILGVQPTVVGLLDTVMLLTDLCLMERQLYFMKG